MTLPEPNVASVSALIVGAEPLHRRRLRQRLEAAGIAPVHEAADGTEAAPLLASELVALVFLQRADSSTSVAELRQLLRGRGPNRRAAVVLLDDGPADAEVVEAVKAGAVAVLAALPGPSELDDLRRTALTAGHATRGNSHRGDAAGDDVAKARSRS